MYTDKGTYIDEQGKEWTAAQYRECVEWLLDRMMEAPARLSVKMMRRTLDAVNQLFVTDGKNVA